MIKTKRIYELYSKEDGFRILVDRLWPRGVSKEKAHLDSWLKEIAPSTELRKWFGHDQNKWAEFKKRYVMELQDNKEAVKELENLAKEHKTITLLYGAKDKKYNQAVILEQVLSS